MGLPFKESSVVESTPKHFSSIQLTQNIFRYGTSTTFFDIGTGQYIPNDIQTGAFAVINENTSLYNNNGGFIIRRKGNYKIEFTFRMLTSLYNPQLNIKKNNVVVNSLILCCFNTNIIGTSTISMTYTGISNIIECNIGDVITFDTNINQQTTIIQGHPTYVFSYINIIEI